MSALSKEKPQQRKGTGDSKMSQSAKLRNTVQPELINIKRNPYLKDYEEQRQLREVTMIGGAGQSRRSQSVRYRSPQKIEEFRPHRAPQRMEESRSHRAPQKIEEYRPHRPQQGMEEPCPRPRNRAIAARRRKIVRRQRLAVGIWALCVLGISVWFLTSKVNASMPERQTVGADIETNDISPASSDAISVQGLPAEVFAAHPDWKEDFLTVNEYSRPGDTLEQVKNIFVHYTANPGTSAAQNRSYFEQQKDTHERSVSAHFIIGYNGEIIQCIPLNEIAYAVQTRNEDSVSIECCFLAADGSFTKETYDSLIRLLAWLTDSYGLATDDILRHYDCGGKKCPLYYTENPSEWEQLKVDVDSMRKNV